MLPCISRRSTQTCTNDIANSVIPSLAENLVTCQGLLQSDYSRLLPLTGAPIGLLLQVCFTVTLAANTLASSSRSWAVLKKASQTAESNVPSFHDFLLTVAPCSQAAEQARQSQLLLIPASFEGFDQGNLVCLVIQCEAHLQEVLHPLDEHQLHIINA